MLLCFQVVTISLIFDFFQQLQLGIVRGLGLYKQAANANLIAYEIFMVPLVTIWLLFGWRDTRVLWYSLMCGYAMVNLCYFFMIWGANLKGSKFYREEASHQISKQHSVLNEDRTLYDGR